MTNLEQKREEKWKPISLVAGRYLVSNFGRIKNPRTGRLVSPNLNHRGYPCVSMYLGRYRSKADAIHRLVAEEFIPNPDNKPCVNHINGNKLDNSVENLEWCTWSENERHSRRLGLNGGEHHARRILSVEIVKDIRRRYPGCRQIDLAKEYGVDQTTISRITCRKNWNQPIYEP